MKKLFPILGLVALMGCASYTTRQTDVSTTAENFYEEASTNSPPTTNSTTRTITTLVKVRTFWAARSDLAKSAVVNTDKSQSSRVGSLSQVATNNLEQVVRIVIEKVP